ncbi:choline dehydrogenase-like flavoprotein [Silvimonas terrae]|uniref:Choline dehydrogenase-like flavoprotein n=1 Tax=Silvimonas terrae TaxID=300266 RepID=A0A840RGK6_9NEIS|nr:GMC oxidoreductase [Silvimonas terrae]MBB5192465.1 choline dehydrogenase-like flavoprotein [Silvimonas terrae]
MNNLKAGVVSGVTVQRKTNGTLLIKGHEGEQTPALLQHARQNLAGFFRQLGVLMIPGSFKPGALGSCIHYAATFPMRANPSDMETDPLGQLARLPGVYIVDGASLSTLPEKSHTLTIMANADRIAKAELTRKRSTG